MLNRPSQGGLELEAWGSRYTSNLTELYSCFVVTSVSGCLQLYKESDKWSKEQQSDQT